MKQNRIIYTALMALLCGVAISSCSDADIKGYYISSDYIKSDAELLLDGNAGTTSYHVVTNGSWSFSNVPSWLTVSPMSGTGEANVTITMTANPSAITQRTGQLTLQTGNESRVISVVQQPARESIEADANMPVFPAAGGKGQVSIRSNTNWTVSVTGNFFTVTPEKGSENAALTVECQPNDSEQERTGYIDVVGSNGTSTRITVSQEGVSYTLVLSPDNVTVNAVGAVVKITLDGDAPWTATSNQEWATLDKISGTGAGDIYVTIPENIQTATRQATITVSTSKKSLQCAILQLAGSAPQVSYPTVTNVGKYGATVSGTFSSDFEVTEYGVCYSETNEKTTIEDPHVSKTVSTTSGEFSFDLTGLKSLTKYYVTIYARNKVGIRYSSYTSFTTTGGVPGEDDNTTPNL